jgi:hypothetical protein
MARSVFDRSRNRCRFCARIQFLKISLAVFDDYTRSSSGYGQPPSQAIRAVQDLSHQSADLQNPASKATVAISPIEEPDLSTTNTHSGADSVVIKQEPHSAWGGTASAKRHRKQS